jgi:hypothetical protein
VAGTLTGKKLDIPIKYIVSGVPLNAGQLRKSVIKYLKPYRKQLTF